MYFFQWFQQVALDRAHCTNVTGSCELLANSSNRQSDQGDKPPVSNRPIARQSLTHNIRVKQELELHIDQ